MSTTKPFLTYDQQIDKLVNEKGLNIADRIQAINILKEHSYFALICGYKQPFKYKNSDKYKKGTTIDDIVALYTFDENLRYILLRYILIVEKRIKSLLAYTFTQKFGEEQRHYLDATKYDYTNIQKQADINKLITKLTELSTPPFTYHYIKHQYNKHNNIPLWVMVKALPFGSISIMYSLSLQSIQAQVSREFGNIPGSDLIRMLDLLSRFRNVCAHNERAYNYRYNKGSITDTEIHKQLLKLHNGRYFCGKSDLFAVIISLKYLIDNNRFQEMIRSINDELDLLFKKTKQIQRLQMYKYMGFPHNWYDITSLKT